MVFIDSFIKSIVICFRVLFGVGVWSGDGKIWWYVWFSELCLKWFEDFYQCFMVVIEKFGGVDSECLYFFNFYVYVLLLLINCRINLFCFNLFFLI